MNDFCQSCSMRLEKDPLKGGSERDGSRSLTYCSYCYEDGAFINPDMSVDEMQALCMSKLQERGLPKFLAWLFTRTMPKLGRWRKNR